MVLDGRNRPQMRNARRPRGRREKLQVVPSTRSNSNSRSTSFTNTSTPNRKARLTVVSTQPSPKPLERSTRRRRLEERSPSRRKASSRNPDHRSESRLERSARNLQSRRQRNAATPRKRRSLFSKGKTSPPGLGLRSPHQLKGATPPKPAAVASRGSTTRLAQQPSGTGLTSRRNRRADLSRRRSTGAKAAKWKQNQQQQQPRQAAPPVSPLTYVLRLLIVGVGLGVIAGTVLASIDPSLRYEPTAAETAAMAATKQPPSTELVLTREMPALTLQLQGLIDQNEGLTAGVMVVDLERDSYASINASQQFASASTIKLPILVALLEEADAGNLDMTELLTMELADIVNEAGEMQFQPPGTQFSVLETATEMIRISDNTATNLLIKRLGGMTLLNDRFRSWGLKQTALQNMLPDLGGTNTISPKDLVTLLGRVNRGDILSAAGRDRLFQILQTTETNDLLPQGIGPGATIAHKTGNIGKSIGDVGLVQMPSGKNYLMMAMVERPHGDLRADELIRNMSWETYQFLESTEQKSEQMVPPNVPRSNIAGENLELDSSIMTTEP